MHYHGLSVWSELMLLIHRVLLGFVLCLPGIVLAECANRGEPVQVNIYLEAAFERNAFLQDIQGEVLGVDLGTVSARMDNGVICIRQDRLQSKWLHQPVKAGGIADLYFQPASDLTITLVEQSLRHEFHIEVYAVAGLPFDNNKEQTSCRIQPIVFNKQNEGDNALSTLTQVEMPLLKDCLGAESLKAVWPSLKAGQQNTWRLRTALLKPEAPKTLKKQMQKLFEPQDIDNKAKKRLRKF